MATFCVNLLIFVKRTVSGYIIQQFELLIIPIEHSHLIYLNSVIVIPVTVFLEQIKFTGSSSHW